jgi:hypothetical protein
MSVQEYHDMIKMREEEIDKSERELLELMAISDYSLCVAPLSDTIGLFPEIPRTTYFSTKSPHRASQIMPVPKKIRYL